MKRINKMFRVPTKRNTFFCLSLCIALLLSGCGTQAASAAASAASAAAETETSAFGSVQASELQETQPEEAAASTVLTEEQTQPASQEAAETQIAAEPAEAAAETEPVAETPEAAPETEAAPAEPAAEAIVLTPAEPAENGILDIEELFSNRDLTQTPDLSEAAAMTVADGQDLHITEAGTYVLSGTASNMTVCVEAPEDAKVQLVLDGLTITNEAAPCIWVSEADKVFVTVSGDSALTVTGAFAYAADEKADAVIFSRSDLTLNGTAALTIDSANHGIVCKDDLKVTGGSYQISAEGSAIKANDSIRIADGSFSITAGSDGLHAENDEDDVQGWLYISGGSFDVNAGDDGLHANSALQIDGGSFTINALEGIEATSVQINGGVISIDSSDDGINATQKSYSWSVMLEINGGEITIVMGSGDTDGLDSNGDLAINGGTVDITGSSAVDYDGTGSLNGGTLIVNGEQTDTLPNQMMGGGRGGWGHGF